MITRKKRMCQGPAVRKTPCGISTRFYCTHFRLGSGSKGISLPGRGPPRSPASSVGMRRGRTSRRCQSWCSRSWGSCRNPEKIEKVLLTVTNYKKEACFFLHLQTDEVLWTSSGSGGVSTQHRVDPPLKEVEVALVGAVRVPRPMLERVRRKQLGM